MPFQSHDIKRNTASNDSRQDTSMFRLSNKEFQLEQALQSPTWIQRSQSIGADSVQKSQGWIDGEWWTITWNSSIIAHEGHQELVKTKQPLRETVCFPGIDKYVKRVVNTCIACQADGPENRPDPLQMSHLPPAPWHILHMDFCGPFPSGEYLFVVIDAYSRFPQVDIVHSTSALAIIPKLDRMFATHGIPTIVCSDNGPQFTSHEIQQYMEENGVQHQESLLSGLKETLKQEGLCNP